jgi:hypothetical protein
MPRALGAALLVLASNCAVAQAPDAGAEPMRVEGTARWGTITDLKEPYYPPSLTDSRAKVYVDISGRVLWSGELAEVEYTPGSEDAKAMIGPMRLVLPHWRFTPPRDHQCQPSGAPVKTRVSFDFATDPPTLSTQTPDALKYSRTIRAVTRVALEFPLHMRNVGWQSHVYARLTIDPAGNVTDVLAIAYPKRPDADLTPFADATVNALRQWKFNPDAEGKGDRYGCWHIFYRLVPRDSKLLRKN